MASSEGSDLGDFVLLVEIVWIIDFVHCLVIGIVRTIDFEGSLPIEIVRTIDFGACV